MALISLNKKGQRTLKLVVRYIAAVWKDLLCNTKAVEIDQNYVYDRACWKTLPVACWVGCWRCEILFLYSSRVWIIVFILLLTTP
jgi:hypothetical protein